MAAVMGIGFPPVRHSPMVTDVTIISEISRGKEEAGTIQGVIAGQDKSLDYAARIAVNQANYIIQGG
jgi:hypothetical protein